MSWRSSLDQLKAAAIAKTLENPQPTDAARDLANAGLKMEMTAWLSKVRGGLDVGLETPPSCDVYGWHLLLSRTKVPAGYLWNFSASLSPKGRASADRDWQMLGRISAYIGAPKEPTIVPENPNDVHHWAWMEPTLKGQTKSD